MEIQKYIESIPSSLANTAHVKTIFGEPVEAHGRTIIPVARVQYGFGGGSGGGSMGARAESERQRQGEVEAAAGACCVCPWELSKFLRPRLDSCRFAAAAAGD